MAARRCLLHGNFPAGWEHMQCQVCGEPTSFHSTGEPDEFWEENIARHQEWQRRADEPVADIPVLEDQPRVRFDGEHYWLHTWDVVSGGVRHRLRESDLVQIGFQTFEILHYEYDRREYMVRPFSTMLTDEELAELAGP